MITLHLSLRIIFFYYYIMLLDVTTSAPYARKHCAPQANVLLYGTSLLHVRDTLQQLSPSRCVVVMCYRGVLRWGCEKHQVHTLWVL